MNSKIPKNIKALGIVSLLNDASSDMIYPLIPLFLTKTLGASYLTVGIIEGIAESTASLMKVFSGWLSDKLKQRKSITVAGYGLSMFSKPLLALATAPWHVLIVRFSDRLGKGIRQAPRDALIAESAKEVNLGYAFGFHKMMDMTGSALGPLLAMVFLPLFDGNYRSIFLLSFFASLLAITTLIIFVREKKPETSNIPFPKLSLKTIPTTYKLFLLAIAIFALGNCSDAFLFLRAQNVGVDPIYIPALYAIMNFCFAALATLFGKLSDKIGPGKIMIGGYLVFSLTHFGFANAATSYSIWGLFLMFGVFASMTESIQKTIAVKISDPQLKGTMLGLMHMTIGIFQLPASILAGFFWERFGPATPFLFGSTTSLIAAGVLFAAFLSSKNQKQTLFR